MDTGTVMRWRAFDQSHTPGIEVSRGRRNGYSDFDPGQASIVVDNSGGAFSPGAENGPLLGASEIRVRMFPSLAGNFYAAETPERAVCTTGGTHLQLDPGVGAFRFRAAAGSSHQWLTIPSPCPPLDSGSTITIAARVAVNAGARAGIQAFISTVGDPSVVDHAVLPDDAIATDPGTGGQRIFLTVPASSVYPVAQFRPSHTGTIYEPPPVADLLLHVGLVGGTYNTGDELIVDQIQVDHGATDGTYSATPASVHHLYRGSLTSINYEWTTAASQSAVMRSVDRLGQGRGKLGPVVEAAHQYMDQALPFDHSLYSGALVELYRLVGLGEGALALDQGLPGIGDLDIVSVNMPDESEGGDSPVQYGQGPKPGAHSDGSLLLAPMAPTSGKYLRHWVASTYEANIMSLCFALNTGGSSTLYADDNITVDIDGEGMLDVSLDGATVFTAGPVTDGRWHSLLVGTNATPERNGAEVSFFLDGERAYGEARAGGINFTGGRLGFRPGGSLFSGALAYYATFNSPIVATVPLTTREALAEGAELLFAGVRSDYRTRSGEATLLVARAAGIPDTSVQADVGRSKIAVAHAGDREVREALALISTTEGGSVYADGAGRVVFRDRLSRLDPPGAPLALAMTELAAPPSLHYSDEILAGFGTVIATSWPGGSTILDVTRSDPMAPGYPTTLGTLGYDYVGALETAAARALKAWPVHPVLSRLAVDPLQSQRWDVLSWQVGDRFTLTGIPSQATGVDGSSIGSQALLIEGVSYTVEVDRWLCLLDVSVADDYEPVLLDSGAVGVELTL